MKDIIKPYFDNLINIRRAADLVVCRAGALTISELIELKKPSVLIPSLSSRITAFSSVLLLLNYKGLKLMAF